MANENTISAQDQQAILDAARKHYHVEESKDAPGYYSIQLDADYGDNNEFLLQTAYDHRETPDNILPAVADQIQTAWEETVSDAVYNILLEAGFDPRDDAYNSQREWFYKSFSINPPINHYLAQDIKVNIMLSTPLDRKENDSMPFTLRDALMHFTGAGTMFRVLEANVHSQAEANELIRQDTMIKRLVEQQGFTMDDLSTVAKDFFHDFYSEENNPEPVMLDENGEELLYDERFDIFLKTHNKFLSTVCQELDNIDYAFGMVTVLANMSMNDYVKMLQQGSEVTMPKDSVIGVFTPLNGCASVLGIELDKDFTFTRDEIYDTQIEGAKLNHNYSVNQVYGFLSSGAWRKPKAIEVKAPERKPGLEQQIQNATAKSAQAAGERTPTVQQER